LSLTFRRITSLLFLCHFCVFGRIISTPGDEDSSTSTDFLSLL
jgi:hypothetical protein